MQAGGNEQIRTVPAIALLPVVSGMVLPFPSRPRNDDLSAFGSSMISHITSSPFWFESG